MQAAANEKLNAFVKTLTARGVRPPSGASVAAVAVTLFAAQVNPISLTLARLLYPNPGPRAVATQEFKSRLCYGERRRRGGISS
jgi:hypothetical protein